MSGFFTSVKTAIASALVTVSANLTAAVNAFSASSGSTLVGWIQGGAGAVIRYIQDKLREHVSVFDFMTASQIADVKAGTLALDMLAAMNAATAYLLANGGTLIFPPGYYGMSGPWNIGLPYYSSFAFLTGQTDQQDTGVEAAAQISANIATNRAYQKINVKFEAGAFLVANFTPLVPTPVVAYNLDNQGHDLTGMIDGVSVITPATMTSGAYSATAITAYPTNNLIGLYTGRGARQVSNIMFAGLGYGLIASRSYWVSFKNLTASYCNDAFHFAAANAATAENLLANVCNRGYVVDGQNFKLASFNTENCNVDFTAFSLDCCTIGPAYFEDVRAAGGAGNFMMMLGTVANTLKITYTNFIGIILLNSTGSAKAGWRNWGIAKGTKINCRSYTSGSSGTDVIDAVSYGNSINSDAGATNSLWYVDGIIKGAWTPSMTDSAGHSTTLSVAYGEYTKSGRLVTAVCHVAWSAIGAVDASPLLIQGLPFPSTTVANSSSSGALGSCSGLPTAKQLTVDIDAGGLSYMHIYQLNNLAAPSGLAANSISATGDIKLTISYLAD